MKIPDFSQEFKGMDTSFPCLTEQPTRYVTIHRQIIVPLVPLCPLDRLIVCLMEFYLPYKI